MTDHRNFGLESGEAPSRRRRSISAGKTLFTAGFVEVLNPVNDVVKKTITVRPRATSPGSEPSVDEIGCATLSTAGSRV